VISAFGHIQTFLEESSDSWLSAVVPPTRPATTEQRQEGKSLNSRPSKIACCQHNGSKASVHARYPEGSNRLTTAIPTRLGAAEAGL
jgi:hypothetical protein